MSTLRLNQILASALPAVGSGKILRFMDQTSGQMYSKNNAGRFFGSDVNAAVAAQGAGFAADTWVTDSDLLVPSFGLQARTTFLWQISASKTGFGTATPIYTIHMGSGRATTDATLLALTGPAQTAIADIGTLIIMATIRSIGAGSAAVLQATAWWDHRGTAANTTTSGTGFANDSTGHVEATSSGFDSTTSPGKYIGLSLNGGTSAAWTLTQVLAEARW